MRAVVIFLALLAAAKIGYYEYLFRAGTSEAVIGAYKVHAVEACQKDAGSKAFGVSPQDWANPKAVKLVIGNRSLDVYPWQVDDARWNARFRNPYLLLTAGQRTDTVACEYDIVNAAASVSRM